MKDTTTSGARVLGGSRRDNHYGRLTARELQVLELLAEGLSNKMISRRLAITPATVKCHVGKILGAMGAANRLEAVILASRLGLLGNALSSVPDAADDATADPHPHQRDPAAERGGR